MSIKDTKPKVDLPFRPKNRKSHDGSQKSSFKAPTTGFEKITFDVNDTNCASRFKDHVDALAGHVGLSLKKEEPAMGDAEWQGTRLHLPHDSGCYRPTRLIKSVHVRA